MIYTLRFLYSVIQDILVCSDRHEERSLRNLPNLNSCPASFNHDKKNNESKLSSNICKELILKIICPIRQLSGTRWSFMTRRPTLCSRQLLEGHDEALCSLHNSILSIVRMGQQPLVCRLRISRSFCASRLKPISLVENEDTNSAGWSRVSMIVCS